MIRFAARAAHVALVLAVSGCALTYDSTQLGVPTTLASAAPRAGATPPTPGTPFRVTKHPVFLLWGLVTTSPPNLEDVLAGQVGTGAAIADLRIRERARWSDFLVTILTAGVIAPRSVTFEGVVVGR